VSIEYSWTSQRTEREADSYGIHSRSLVGPAELSVWYGLCRHGRDSNASRMAVVLWFFDSGSYNCGNMTHTYACIDPTQVKWSATKFACAPVPTSALR